jgi:hypothetical protein
MRMRLYIATNDQTLVITRDAYNPIYFVGVYVGCRVTELDGTYHDYPLLLTQSGYSVTAYRRSVLIGLRRKPI